MRILYHHRTLGDGAEGIHINEMVTAFTSLGHEVHLLGTVGEGASTSHGLARRVKAALPGAVFEAATVGVNAAEYLKVRRWIKRLRPHFLYKRHARLDIGAVRAARAMGVPIVLEVNCLFSAEPYERFEPMTMKRLGRALERHALAMSDIVLAVSTPLARQISDLAGVAPVVLPNGVDPNLFDPARAAAAAVRARYGLGSALTIGWSGVIREWHGLDRLLDAVAALRNVRVLVVGDGPGRVSLEEQAAARGITDRMVITGRVAHEQMPEHLAAMDIAVVPGDGTGVASPMKLIEYMAMSRAVVAPRLANIVDVITDETDGLLFSTEDGDSLTRVLQRLIADRALRERLGHAARVKVAHSRTWRHNAEYVLALVHERPTGRRDATCVAAE
jgi:glycosyltransferase involved in cell wall biosynthesis